MAAEPSPLISVVVPVYNGQETLARCLEALCRQTLPRRQYEILVIDDGSTDRTPQIAAQFPVRVVRLEKNSGRIVARARGAAEAACGLLAFCDCRVICEPTVLKTALDFPKRPLMLGSDCPEDWHKSLFGRFFFCLHHWLWKPYWPQEWHGPEVEINSQNFDRMPKGATFFVVERDFYLRHQPRRSDKHVSDDTLLMAGMVRERPIIRYCPLRCHYQQRTDLRTVVPHLHERGIRFSSYYLRPWHRYFILYVTIWAAAIALAIAASTWPPAGWVALAAALAAWVGVSALWATSAANFLVVLLLLPVVAAAFGSGILRSHWIDATRWKRSLEGPEMFRRGRLSAAMSWLAFAAVVALAAWYLHQHWSDFVALPAIRWYGWATLAALILAGHVTTGLVIDRMARCLDVRLAADEWLGLSFLTALGNLLGPARIGIVLRSVYLKRRGLPYAHFVSSLGGTYIVTVLAQMLLAAAGLAVLYAQGRAPQFIITLLVAVPLTFTAVLAIWSPSPPAWLAGKVPLAARVLEGWKTIVSKRRIMWQTLGCCLVGMVTNTMLYWLCYRMLGHDVPVQVVVVAVAIGSLGAMIAVTPAAVGFFDIPAILTGAVLGVPASASVAALLIVRAADVATNFAFGPFWVWHLLRRKAPQARGEGAAP